jgi:hypothetical protein
MADGPGLVERLRAFANRRDALDAADRIEELERAVELSRVWWDDADPYHAPWDHSTTCKRRPCGACQARAAAMAASGRR